MWSEAGPYCPIPYFSKCRYAKYDSRGSFITGFGVLAMKSTLKKFSRKSDRRAYDRFSIPGATITWKTADQDSFPDDTMPVSDISRVGLSLLTNKPPEVHSFLLLRILLPKQPEILDLLGTVVYVVPRGPGLTYEYRVGIELKPFSGNEGENTRESLQKIEKLEQKYGKRFENVDIED